MSITPNLKQIEQTALEYGLVIRGGFLIDQADGVPNQSAGGESISMVLFGNAGSSLWSVFSGSSEYLDNDPDPLDRWSRRIGEQLAREWSALALFPFGGPPFQPFLQWAKKAEQLESSKLGMLIHPKYGLWHAYRFAIAFPYVLTGMDFSEKHSVACTTCADQPCLAGCPVGAFSLDHYDVESCFQFLDQNPDASCHFSGCQARRACPEGGLYRYDSDHAAFHMAKFYESLSSRFKP